MSTTTLKPITVTYVPGETTTLDFVEGKTVADYVPELAETQSVSIDGKPADKDTVVDEGVTLVIAGKAANG